MTFSGHIFMGRPMLIFLNSSSIINYADIQDNKKNSLITDYAADFQYQMRNNFITNYIDYADFRDYIKNNFINDYADYADF